MSVSFATPETPVPPFPVRRFSVEEYRRLGEAGILAEEDRVELLEGWIVPMMVRNPPHDVSVGLTQDALSERLPDGWHLRVQAVIATRDSVPEPDLAVVRGARRDYLARHPSAGEISLVVEVAETSLDRDRRKAKIYSAAGISAYWIVDLRHRCVEIYSDPQQPKGYGTQRSYTESETAPLTIGGQSRGEVAVGELLP